MLELLLAGSLISPFPSDIHVYRDKWGVPSIVAQSYADAVYALGYMQVTDDGERVATNYKIARGRSAEVVGKSSLLVDGFLRGLEIEEHAQQTKLPPADQAVVDSFLAGENKALQDHKGKLPAWIEPFTQTDVLSLVAFTNCAFPLLDLANEVMPGFGSNQFAVAPSRSATGHPILSMDPHLDWNGGDGGILWYECGIFTPTMQFRGVSIPGLPGCVMGHNAKFGWSITNNDPRLFVRYTVVTNPADKSQYSYHGEWRSFRTKQFTLRYRDGGQLKEQNITQRLTDWGPMIPLRAEAAYVEPLHNAVGIAQIQKMMEATNASQFRAALQMHGLSMWNFVFAGSDGVIGYQYNAALRKRDSSVDWLKPVPGNDPKTRLQDNFWSMDELPHTINPASGMLVNCNSDPALVPVTSKLTGTWPAYVTDYGLTSRYRLLSDLLKTNSHLDPYGAQRIATDTKVPFAKAAIHALSAIPELRGDPLVAVLDRWDGRANIDSRGTAAFTYWLTQSPKIADLAIQVAHGQTWTAEDRELAKSAIAAATEKMKADGLALDVRWGEVLRMQRGAKEIGVEGYNGITGNPVVAVNPSGPTRTLKTMQPKIVAGRGSSFRMIVSFEPTGVRSWSVLPYGNSQDPSSPYFANQMDLFAVGRYKETVFGAEAAKRTATQTIELQRAPQ